MTFEGLIPEKQLMMAVVNHLGSLIDNLFIGSKVLRITGFDQLACHLLPGVSNHNLEKGFLRGSLLCWPRLCRRICHRR